MGAQRQAVVHGVALALACLGSYELVTEVLSRIHSVSHEDDVLGGMWAVVATIFVYRDTHDESVGAAVSRVAATIVSFLLCSIYLAFLPFHAWGLALLIAIGVIVVNLVGRPGDSITVGITTTVILVVASESPQDHVWQQPILRLVDTFVGIGVGIVAGLAVAAITDQASRLGGRGGGGPARVPVAPLEPGQPGVQARPPGR